MRIISYSIRIYLLLLALSTVVNKMSAQPLHDYCGTPESKKARYVDVEKMLSQRSAMVAPEVLKVFVHLTTNNSGSLPTTSLDTVMARVDDMRREFNNHGICFIVAGIDIIRNTDLDTQIIFTSIHEESELIPYIKPGMLNVFVHHHLIQGNVTGGGNAYDIPNPYLSLDDEALSEGCCKLILIHEMGHCLGLHHTHAGGNENVDRIGICKNCETTGDLLCDTPADPDLSVNNALNGCNYVGNSTDACGWAYAPDPQNIMSYAPRTCQSYFSVGQGLRMQWHLQNITDLNVTIVPLNIVFSTTGSWSSGEHFYLAEQNVTLNSVDLSVVNAAQVTFGAGNAVSIFPGTTFTPQSGFVQLSAQDVCQP